MAKVFRYILRMTGMGGAARREFLLGESTLPHLVQAEAAVFAATDVSDSKDSLRTKRNVKIEQLQRRGVSNIKIARALSIGELMGKNLKMNFQIRRGQQNVVIAEQVDTKKKRPSR